MTEPIASSPSGEFEFTGLNEAQNYRAALLREFGSHLKGNVLEVGAGVGQMTGELLEIPGIKTLVSIEPNPVFCAQILERFPQLDLIQGTLSDLKVEKDWNAVISINVLEHIQSDQDELASYHRLLHPTRGTLCLFVPARPEIYAPIDEDFGHFRRYTRPELRRKLEEASFRIVYLRYYNFVGYFAWWAIFRLLKKRTFNVAAVRLFDRAVFPLVRAFETHVCRPPIGQSLIVVAEAC